MLYEPEEKREMDKKAAAAVEAMGTLKRTEQGPTYRLLLWNPKSGVAIYQQVFPSGGRSWRCWIHHEEARKASKGWEIEGEAATESIRPEDFLAFKSEGFLLRPDEGEMCKLEECDMKFKTFAAMRKFVMEAAYDGSYRRQKKAAAMKTTAAA